MSDGVRVWIWWWENLKPHIQQQLANKYHPDDDFIQTHQSSNRIYNIYNHEVK